MTAYLRDIIRHKKSEIKRHKDAASVVFNQITQVCRRPSFGGALRAAGFGVIAEIKRKSPSAGTLSREANACEQARHYLAGGAAAISVLTDRRFFGGSGDDLLRVSSGFPNAPVLMKEFIVDRSQLQHAVCLGASAVLLIVAVLKAETRRFLQDAQALGLECLVEVHDAREADIALEAGATVIGVNNRNLRTFEVDLAVSERISPRIPPSVIKVSESGIRTPEDAKRMADAGFHAILVGEALMRSVRPAWLLSAMIEAGVSSKNKRSDKHES